MGSRLTVVLASRKKKIFPTAHSKKKKKKINSTLEPGAHSAGDRAIDCHAQIHVVTVHVFSFDMYNEHEPHVTVALTRLKCLRRRHRVRATFPTTAYPHHHLRLSRRQPYPPHSTPCVNWLQPPGQFDIRGYHRYNFQPRSLLLFLYRQLTHGKR